MGKKSGSKASLKATLRSRQSSLKTKEKISRSAQVAEQRSKRNSQQSYGNTGKGKAKILPLRPTIPCHPTNRILLIGEGNFSFAFSLVQDAPKELEFLPPGNVTATAYDTEEECYEKYPESHSIVAALKEKGVEVLFGIDATKLDKVAALKGRRWDRIVWNFPHAGKSITDQDRNILINQLLILGFLRSSAHLLTLGPMPLVVPHRKRQRDSDEEDDMESVQSNDTSEDKEITSTSHSTSTRGTILITLRNVVPYTLWDIPRLAKNPPPSASKNSTLNPSYTLLRSFTFHRSLWKGYEHRMTKGERLHGKGKTGEGGEDRTWEFCLKDVTIDNV